MKRSYNYQLPNMSTVFLIQSSVFLAGLTLLALVLAWVSGVNPFVRIHFRANDLLVGTLAAVAMVSVFSLARYPREQAQKLLGPFLQDCGWLTLLILACFIGFSEELLFRGVLEPWAARFIGPIAALIVVNILFASLHSLSVQYAFVAGFLGMLLSLLAWGPGGDNLLRAMTTHSVYDFLAFLWVAHVARREARNQLPVEALGEDAHGAADDAFGEPSAQESAHHPDEPR